MNSLAETWGLAYSCSACTAETTDTMVGRRMLEVEPLVADDTSAGASLLAVNVDDSSLPVVRAVLVASDLRQGQVMFLSRRKAMNLLDS